ncbi:MAG: hypothetical protein PVF62_11935, partial [Desulfobacterales bacterium]
YRLMKNFLSFSVLRIYCYWHLAIGVWHFLTGLESSLTTVYAFQYFVIMSVPLQPAASSQWPEARYLQPVARRQQPTARFT